MIGDCEMQITHVTNSATARPREKEKERELSHSPLNQLQGACSLHQRASQDELSPAHLSQAPDPDADVRAEAPLITFGAGGRLFDISLAWARYGIAWHGMWIYFIRGSREGSVLGKEEEETLLYDALCVALLCYAR
jgi:hypothetical protein